MLCERSDIPQTLEVPAIKHCYMIGGMQLWKFERSYRLTFHKAPMLKIYTALIVVAIWAFTALLWPCALAIFSAAQATPTLIGIVLWIIGFIVVLGMAGGVGLSVMSILPIAGGIYSQIHMVLNPSIRIYDYDDLAWRQFVEAVTDQVGYDRFAAVINQASAFGVALRSIVESYLNCATREAGSLDNRELTERIALLASVAASDINTLLPANHQP